MSDPTYQELVTRLQNERLAHRVHLEAVSRHFSAQKAAGEAWQEVRDAACEVIDVYKDPDAMLAYLRGDHSKLHEAIMHLEAVLGPR